MLKLLLNDGINDVIAIELERIPDISFESTKQGSKLKLKGNVEVRRGLYLLKWNHLKALWNNKDDMKIFLTVSTFG